MIIKAGFYQFSPEFGKKHQNLEKVLRVLSEVRDALIVLPEFFATGYQFACKEEVEELAEPIPQGVTTEQLVELAKANSLYIVAGLPEVADGRYYNSAVLVGPEGYIGRYRKTHLFFEEKLYFEAGDTGFIVWETEVGRIGIMICFDWFFPEAARVLSLRGADIIAHPANLVLPWCPQSMPVRCLENRVFAITANRTGIEQRKEDQTLRFIGQSQIVSPVGEVLLRASEDAEEIHLHEIDLSSTSKEINPFNDLFLDRRPSMYGPLVED